MFLGGAVVEWFHTRDDGATVAGGPMDNIFSTRQPAPLLGTWMYDCSPFSRRCPWLFPIAIQASSNLDMLQSLNMTAFTFCEFLTNEWFVHVPFSSMGWWHSRREEALALQSVGCRHRQWMQNALQATTRAASCNADMTRLYSGPSNGERTFRPSECYRSFHALQISAQRYCPCSSL